MVVGELTESTEVAVLGAGPGGYVAAIRAAQLGKEVSIVSDEDLPGGVCLLRGCIPSKALIEAANLYRRIQGAEVFGIRVGKPAVDFPAMQQWKEGVVRRLGTGVETLLQQNGVKVYQGKASFLASRRLEIQTEAGPKQLAFEQAIVATGGRPRAIPGLDFDGRRILSSDHALRLAEIPESLLVIGGGYIGLELGEVYAKLGSRVTVVEALPELASGTDPALLRPLKKKLKELGIEVLLETQVASCRARNAGVESTLRLAGGEEKTRSDSHVLVTIGRQPNTEDLGLERVGIRTDAKGYIPVNRRGQTEQPHIYAIGDVAGGIQLAHKASREGIVAASNIAGRPDAFDNQVPAVIFTDPEIAYVGLSEAQAKAQGLETQIGMFGFAANGRALTMEDSQGFVKVVAEKSTHRVLGVQMVGPHVSDLISEATLGLEMGALLDDFDLTIHPHPTLSEALHEAIESVEGRSIHRYQKR